PFLYFWTTATLMPLVLAYARTALETSRLKLSSALSMATLAGLGVRVSARAMTPWRYLLAGLSTPNVYLSPWLKIDWAAPWASTIGIAFCSAMAASVAVAALPYGPSRKLALSSVMSFCISTADWFALDVSS